MDSTTEEAPELSAEQRREARRKRILQSAKSRLEKLKGGPISEEHFHTERTRPEVVDYSDPEVEPNVPFENAFRQEEPDLFSSRNFMPQTVHPPNLFIKGRFHIFIASILGCVLARYVPNSLFVPVFLCLIIEVFYFKEHENPQNNIISTILPVLLLFTGAKLSSKLQQINKLLSISQSLIINLAVNIFCVCVSCYIFQLNSLSHVVDVK